MSDPTLVDDALVHPPADENAAKIVWALAWPAVALNSLQVINNLLDRTFIGHLPASALTAQSASMSLMFLMFSLAMTLGTAATALVSRAYGGEKIEELKAASRKCISLTILCGLLAAVFCWLSSPPVARVLLPKGDSDAIGLMVQFLTAYAIGLPAIFLIQTLAGALRGIGDTKSPMVISGIQILLHITLNYILIFPPRHVAGGITVPGFNLGLVGAAVALSTSAWISAIAYLVWSGKTLLGELWRIELVSFEWAKRILSIAIPAAGMAVLRVASLAVFTLVLKYVPEGSAAIAGMGPGFSIESIMFMPSFGLSMAAAALVGQSLGMQRPERAERLAWKAAHHAAIVTMCLAVPIFFFAPAIAGAMIEAKPAIAAQTTELIRWLCVTEISFAYAMVMIGAMQGAGDTVRPLWITVVALWVVRVPLTFLLAIPFTFGAPGAWFAMSLSQALQGIFAVVAFRQGKWKLKKV